MISVLAVPFISLQCFSRIELTFLTFFFFNFLKLFYLSLLAADNNVLPTNIVMSALLCSEKEYFLTVKRLGQAGHYTNDKYSLLNPLLPQRGRE